MLQTQFSNLKKGAAELVDCSNPEDFVILLQAALASDDCKSFSQEETREYFAAIENLYIFLQKLSFLFGYNSIDFPPEFKTRSEFLEYKLEVATNDQVINLVSALFDKVPARKLIWDLYTVFTSAITTEKFLKEPILFSGISFSLKLITQFIRNYELMGTFNVEERICLNPADFDPLSNN